MLADGWLTVQHKGCNGSGGSVLVNEAHCDTANGNRVDNND